MEKKKEVDKSKEREDVCGIKLIFFKNKISSEGNNDTRPEMIKLIFLKIKIMGTNY